MKLTAFLSSVAILSSISIVNAADTIRVKAITPPSTAFNWAGPYLGIETGTAFSHFYSTDGFSNSAVRNLFGRPKSTILAGIYGGYNLNLGQEAIFGIDGNIDWHPSEARKILINDPDFYNFYSETARAAIRVRLGLAHGKAMPYLAGGLTILRAGQTTGLVIDGIADPKRHQQNYTGWNIGGGMDYAIAHNIALRADYRFSKIPVKDYYFVSGANWTKRSRNIGMKSHEVRIGAAYKF